MIQAVMTAPEKIGLGEVPGPKAGTLEVCVLVKHIGVFGLDTSATAPIVTPLTRKSKAKKVVIKLEQEK